MQFKLRRYAISVFCGFGLLASCSTALADSVDLFCAQRGHEETGFHIIVDFDRSTVTREDYGTIKADITDLEVKWHAESPYLPGTGAVDYFNLHRDSGKLQWSRPAGQNNGVGWARANVVYDCDKASKKF
ncbi:MAG: hypothetical protein ABSH46_17430 [Bryobacteraceae bacterium]